MDQSYYGVGSSNMDDNGYEKATLYKYDSNYKLLWEKRFKSKYNSTFYNIVEDGDFLLAVGSYEKTKEENEEKLDKEVKSHTAKVDWIDKVVPTAQIQYSTRENAEKIVVTLVNESEEITITNNGTSREYTFNKDGEVLFKKDLQILGNSKFVNLLVLDDGYVVVGQSIYANNVLGNDDSGGAIIIKYDKDGKEIWRQNTGGNKSGLFNSVIQDGDYLYAVGKDATRYGMIAKYTLDGEKEKAVSYAKTDTIGFSNIVKFGDQFICVGAKKIKEDDEYDHDIDGLLVAYNSNLEKTNEVTYKDTKKGLERFNDIIVDKDNLIVVGHEAVVDKENSTSKEYVYNYRSFILKFDSSLKKKEEIIYKENLDDYFTDIKLVKGKYLVSGYKKYKFNKYKTFFVHYSRDFK